MVGNDPWMAPTRTLNPTWSPDSKWVAYASHFKSLYHAIFVSNVETGETRQVTDGLADSMWPVWDANGKYPWFLASTDFGLKSQWLDMTSYDHEENFGLYLAVLKKSEPSPLLPESDEDGGVGSVPPAAPLNNGAAGSGGRAGESQTPEARAPRTPVTVTIGFDGLQQRIVAIPGVPERPYSQLRAGVTGTVYYIEAADGRGRGGTGGPGTLLRYRLNERKAFTLTEILGYRSRSLGRYVIVQARLAPRNVHHIHRQVSHQQGAPAASRPIARVRGAIPRSLQRDY